MVALLVNTLAVLGAALYVGRRDQILTQNTADIGELRIIVRDLTLAMAINSSQSEERTRRFADIEQRLGRLELREQ